MRSFKFNILIIPFVITATILLFNSYSTADVIFNNFGPGDTYQTDWGWTLSLGSPIGADFDQGDPFKPSGIDFYLDNIELAVGLVLGPNELDVWLMSDNSNKPGTIIESFHFSGAMGTFGEFNPPLSMNSVFHPLLEENTQYWLIASTTGPDEWAAWNWNSIGETGTHALRQDLGPWNIYTDTQGGRFESLEHLSQNPLLSSLSDLV
jgi:hypothetical protein